MYSLKIVENSDEKFTLEKIMDNLKEQERRLLEERVEIEPRLYDAYLKQREITNKKVPREPQSSAESLYPGTWYLKSIDASYRRLYARRDQAQPFDQKLAAQLINQNLSLILESS